MFDQFLNKETLQMEEERLKDFFSDKESELRDLQSKMSLCDYSTTQLKAELRRRKKERGEGNGKVY